MSEENNERDLSSCEKMIMKIVWDSETDISTPEIIDLIKVRYGKDYARTTVVTFVQRLTEKGYVTTYRKGRISYVHAEKDEQRYTENFLKHIEDFWFHGETSSLLSALCKKNKPTKEQIDKMKKILDQLES